ncbi:hypothetical protein ACFPYJ_01325 [Paenibacillus solisilvae]|uniref:Uncharacterized protein n=1 Tax=Paenibacillus solisilvae TaxID=2486751 RepID=A0ABW0VPG0_9BACL
MDKGAELLSIKHRDATGGAALSGSGLGSGRIGYEPVKQIGVLEPRMMRIPGHIGVLSD